MRCLHEEHGPLTNKAGVADCALHYWLVACYILSSLASGRYSQHAKTKILPTNIYSVIIEHWQRHESLEVFTPLLNRNNGLRLISSVIFFSVLSLDVTFHFDKVGKPIQKRN